MSRDIWIETISDLLETMGKLEHFTEEEIVILGGDLHDAHDMMNEHASYGVPSSSDLWENERREIEKHHKDQVKDLNASLEQDSKTIKHLGEDIRGLQHNIWRLKNGLEI